MIDQEWIAYLNTLSPELSDLAQHMMERLTTVLAADRSLMLGDLDRMDRRLELVQREIEALNIRMDEWDGGRSHAVGE